RFLSDVRMLWASVDLELRDLFTRQAITRHHALHGQPENLLWPAGQHFLKRPRTQPSGVAGMAVVALVFALVPAHGDLLRVDYHDEIAGIDVRGVLGLALTPQHVGDLGS